MPSFFEEVDATGIVETHIQQALAMQKDQAEIILEKYRETRAGLISRLSALPPGSFTAQHLRGTLAQVQGAIEAMTRDLSGDTKAGSIQAAMMGVDGLLKELRVFDQKFLGAVTPINLNAAAIAADVGNLLVTRYNTNLAAYGNDLFTQISNGLFSAAIGEANTDEVVGRISRFFNGEEWKLHRIVRTELHHVFNLGKMQGMVELQDDLPDLKKTLMHPLDARTGEDSEYAASLHLVAEVDEPFEYRWSGKIRSFMAPPDRPNDRAIMVPYREEWGAARGSAFLPGRYPAA